MVAGELELELAEAHQTFGIGEEFTIPANIYFQATAGHSGAQLLLAKKRSLISIPTPKTERDHTPN